MALSVYRAVWGRSTVTLADVLQTTLVQAGFQQGSSVYNAAMATATRTDSASVTLRRSWLLRNHLVRAAREGN